MNHRPSRPTSASSNLQAAHRVPLDEAVAFARYRLLVISRWPDGELKEQTITTIERALKSLEAQRVDPHHHPAARIGN